MSTALTHLLTAVLAATPTVLVPPALEGTATPPHQGVGSAPAMAPAMAPSTGSPTALPTGSPAPLSTGSSSFQPVVAPESGAWPLAPAPDVVRAFDPPVSTYGAGHRGVDLRGTVGQPVRAARSGRVTYAGSLAGRGVVVIDHGTTRTTYEPVSPEVAVGSPVGAGERIGSLQGHRSHCAPAACLHWGLIEGSTYLDPLSLVGAGPVRLLPLTAARPSVT